jgi:tetratricopeptide (TPR) repeat protein
MSCRTCGHDARETAQYCEQCGAILRRDDPASQLVHAYRLEVAGKLDEAVEEYERLLEHAPVPSEMAAARKHLGNLHFRLGHLRRAREHLARACESDPGRSAFWHDKGVVEYHAAGFDEAIQSFRIALDLNPDHQLAYFWLGNALYHRGELDEAATAFRDLLDRYPNFTIARFHLGVIYARQGKKEDSEEEFRRVLSKNPEAAAARFYVGS